MVGDYDHDGRDDQAVFRSGHWLINGSTSGLNVLSLGLATDLPVPADYDGDGSIDAAVFQGSVWLLLTSANSQVQMVAFGASGDKPVASASIAK